MSNSSIWRYLSPAKYIDLLRSMQTFPMPEEFPDLKMQDQLVQAAGILDVRVLDHIIVTKKGHYSFQEAGLVT